MSRAVLLCCVLVVFGGVSCSAQFSNSSGSSGSEVPYCPFEWISGDGFTGYCYSAPEGAICYFDCGYDYTHQSGSPNAVCQALPGGGYGWVYDLVCARRTCPSQVWDPVAMVSAWCGNGLLGDYCAVYCDWNAVWMNGTNWAVCVNGTAPGFNDTNPGGFTGYWSYDLVCQPYQTCSLTAFYAENPLLVQNTCYPNFNTELPYGYYCYPYCAPGYCLLEPWLGIVCTADCGMGCTGTHVQALASTACIPCSTGNETSTGLPPPTSTGGEYMSSSSAPDIVMSSSAGVGPGCPSGYQYNPSTGGCDLCAPGTYSPSGYYCASCPPGTVSPAGAGDCNVCPPGTYSPGGYGSWNCRPCAGGTYAISPGAAQCNECPAGSYSLPDRTDCDWCAPGTTSPAGASCCQACHVAGCTAYTGSYCECCASDACQGQIDQCVHYSPDCTACNTCRAGYVLVGSFCEACPDGTHGTQGASQCLPCHDGTHSNPEHTACIPS